jgi:hypothetical protein
LIPETRHATADALLGELVRSNAYGRPYDWIEGTGARLIGDLAKFEALRQRFPEQVEVWDRDGNRVR